MYKEYFDRVIHENCQVVHNPSVDSLRQMAKHHEVTTKHGHACYITKIRSRSAKHTYHVNDGIELGKAQKPIDREQAREIYGQVLDYLKDKEMIQIDRRLGQHEDVHFNARLYVTRPYARLAHMWSRSLFEYPYGNGETVDLLSVHVPEWEETKIVVDPLEGFTLILGSDYFGETKKSFLRKAMFEMKQKHGGLGLHAGSKKITVKDKKNKTKDVGYLLFGLSGTGKTTLTVHDYGLQQDEGEIAIKQDDVVLLDEQGSCYGTERGFFIKTEGLDESQEVLFAAARRPESIFENVHISEDGAIDFTNTDLTSNGRGIVLRDTVKFTDQDIDLQQAHKLIFITRRDDIVPPVAKLTAEQGAAFFMLGESIETSAGDPTKAGQSKREVGTNPFIIGKEEEEGNCLLEILRKNPDMQCFLLNTGRVGKKANDPGKKINITLSTHILKHLAYDDITWEKDPDWGYEVPTSIPGIDIGQFDPRKFYSAYEYQQLTDKLRQERLEWLQAYSDLDRQILQTMQQ
jgi:phosphoenolpyruvate carboxykinase (ATP)